MLCFYSLSLKCVAISPALLICAFFTSPTTKMKMTSMMRNAAADNDKEDVEDVYGENGGR